MKFTLGELRKMGPALDRLAKKELPVSISYRVAKFLKKVSDELFVVEKERIKLIQRFGQMHGEEKKVIVPPDKMDTFQKEFNALLDEEVEIEVSSMDAKDFGSISISPQDIVLLERIISFAAE
jgi:homogentisate 1,2-dioxygenase